MKPRVDRLGKTVVERTPDGEILVCLPDGSIEVARDARHARAIHDAWQRARTSSIAVATIEWRGFGESEVPA